MGYFLVLLYLTLTYLSPEQLYPELVPYRILLWVAALAVLVTLPVLLRETWLWTAPQTYLLFGLLGAMMLSHLAHLWFGGIVFTIEMFLPSLIVFFLIALHVNTWTRARILVLLLVLLGVGIMSRGIVDLHLNHPNSAYVLKMNWDTPDARLFVLRIRGVGFLSDPNDFAQYLIVLLPLVSLAWQKGRKFRDLFLVIVPTAVIIYGIYLTRSRGALLAVVVLCIVFLRRRLPLPIAATIAVLAYVGMVSLGFTGGRGVSVESGTERIELWGRGLQLFKSSPLWGVGFGKFTDFAWLTAHNSYVLCLAEVGMIGYTFWLSTVVITLLTLTRLTVRPAAVVKTAPAGAANAWVSSASSFSLEAVPDDAEAQPAQPSPPGDDPKYHSKEVEEQERIRRWAIALRYSLIGFLVTAWFLSRTYTTTLYVLVALAAVVARLTNDSPAERKQRRRHWLPITVAAAMATIVILYAIVRIGPYFGV